MAKTKALDYSILTYYLESLKSDSLSAAILEEIHALPEEYRTAIMNSNTFKSAHEKYMTRLETYSQKASDAIELVNNTSYNAIKENSIKIAEHQEAIERAERALAELQNT